MSLSVFAAERKEFSSGYQSVGNHVKRVIICASAIVFFSLFCTSVIDAQPSNTIPNRGYKPANSYTLGDIETVNTINGNMMLNIPLASLPAGRGGSPGASLNLIYNSKLYDINSTLIPVDPNAGYTSKDDLVGSSEGGWHYGIRFSLKAEYLGDHYSGVEPPQCPDSQALYTQKLSIVFPDGSNHELRPYGYSLYGGYSNVTPDGYVTDSCGPGYPSGHWVYDPITYYTTDGTFVRVQVDHDDESGNSSNNAWTLYLPDGRRVTNTPPFTNGHGLQRIYDRNNNYTEISDTTYNGHAATQITDQLNRSIVIESGIDGYDYIHVTGVNSTPLTWTVKWSFTYVNKTYFPTDVQGPQTLGIQFRVVERIDLPSQLGGLSYNFGYNGSSSSNVSSTGYAELNSLTLPSGANAVYQYHWDNSDSLNSSEILMDFPANRTLTYQQEYDGNSSSVTETRQYTPANWGGFTSTVIDSDGGVTNTSVKNTSSWDNLLPYKTVKSDGTVS